MDRFLLVVIACVAVVQLLTRGDFIGVGLFALAWLVSRKLDALADSHELTQGMAKELWQEHRRQEDERYGLR